MFEKIKSYISYILGLALLIVSALLFRQQRKTDNVESALAKEKANDEIKGNDHDREIAKQNADELVNDYERRKREYDKSRGDV